MRRHRALQNDAKNIGVVIHFNKATLAFILCQVGRPVLLVERQPYRRSGTRLSANVDGYFFDIANSDRYQPAHLATRAKAADIICHIIENALPDFGTIEQARVALCGHCSSPTATVMQCGGV